MNLFLINLNFSIIIMLNIIYFIINKNVSFHNLLMEIIDDYLNKIQLSMSNEYSIIDLNRTMEIL